MRTSVESILYVLVECELVLSIFFRCILFSLSLALIGCPCIKPEKVNLMEKQAQDGYMFVPGATTIGVTYKDGVLLSF